MPVSYTHLMQRTGADPDDIDLVIVATSTPDYHFNGSIYLPVSYTHLFDVIPTFLTSYDGSLDRVPSIN